MRATHRRLINYVTDQTKTHDCLQLSFTHLCKIIQLLENIVGLVLENIVTTVASGNAAAYCLIAINSKLLVLRTSSVTDHI